MALKISYFKKWRMLSHFLVLATFFLLPTPLPGFPQGLLKLDFNQWVIYLLGVPLPKELFYLFFLLILLALVGALVLSVIMGKVFCGWICPQNIYFELLERIHSGLKKRFPGYRKTPFYQRSLDFALTFIFAALTSLNVQRYFVGLHLYVKIYLMLLPFGVFMLLVHVYKHRFCQNICPLAMFQKSLQVTDSLHIRYDSHRENKPCGVCYACEKACYVNIDIKKDPFHMDCTLCGACVDACTQVYSRKSQPPLLAYSVPASSFISHLKRRSARLASLSLFCLALLVYGFNFVYRPEVHIQMQAYSKLIGENHREFEIFIANLSSSEQSLTFSITPGNFIIEKGSQEGSLTALERKNLPLTIRYTGKEEKKLSEVRLEVRQRKGKKLFSQDFYFHHH